ncbi:hypothetical protein SLOPH_1717 [Spraguea lophii 42_110]|uniref:Uncharacterized protein n=1 Tax=Spraguea lophii (strain 42_110) TaxID=1358809 RepID=S7W8T0_SPRLO|nr:hypothetical protein SLOPH_1717 [Spraguea lophii 42_110]
MLLFLPLFQSRLVFNTPVKTTPAETVLCDFAKIDKLLSQDLVINAFLGENSKKCRESRISKDKAIGITTVELRVCNDLCPLSPLIDECKFVSVFTSYIYHKLDYFIRENRIYRRVIRRYLRMVYNHFIRKENNPHELAIFMANSFHNTSFLKIFLTEAEINGQTKVELGVNYCRGVLQIKSWEYYTITDCNIENIKFSKEPRKMAILSKGALSGTFSFWEYMICEIKKDCKKVTYNNVLKFLNPEEVQAQYKDKPEYKEKLAHRRYVYNEILTILGFYR